MIPSCFTTLLQHLRDRWICWYRGPLETIADGLHADLRDAEQEIVTLTAALSESMHDTALAVQRAEVAEAERDVAVRDRNDVLGFRADGSSIWQHPSFGGDQ